ncbi:MAG TPA: phosphatase PAP2 family protein [Streptosporangiaceae bacterium]|nr:phosphatase PAP2 family protein [Streptosporangiaceae bacterium]
MGKYLVALIWPVGIAIIAGAAFLVATSPRTATRPQAATATAARNKREAVPAARRSHKASGPRAGFLDACWGSARFAILAALGALIIFGLMCALGVLVVNHGLAIDQPIFRWMNGHQVHVMAALMNRLTKIGNTWTVWGAAFAAAACLTVSWRSSRWLPAVAFAVVIVGDHYTTLALRHVFHRLGPPTSPLGTFPSGGCDRVILFYGLIGYLLWREFSGQRRTAIGIGAAVAALGFNEAYSRVYLGLHWFTDALSGLLYGVLLLVAFIFAVEFVAGRQVVTRPADPPAPADVQGVSAVAGLQP